MANAQHLDILQKGESNWHEWKTQNQGIQPDLREADLSGVDLSGVDLSGVDLSKANLHEANLSGASLTHYSCTWLFVGCLLSSKMAMTNE